MPENTYILKELLQDNSMNVIIKNKAKDALEMYKSNEQHIDLLITDLRMPDMSGQHLMIEIRNFEKTANKTRVPIIVLTGESAAAEKVACLTQYGADAYLLKPVKLSDLLSTVQIILHKRVNKTTKDILIIDDDLLGQSFISSVIKLAGHRSHSCTCVNDAKSHLEQNLEKYDLILLDSHMPDGTGRDFMERYMQIIKGMPKPKKIPVLSISGNTIHTQEELYEGYEIYAFLVKPLSKKALIDIIESIKY